MRQLFASAAQAVGGLILCGACSSGASGGDGGAALGNPAAEAGADGVSSGAQDAASDRPEDSAAESGAGSGTQDAAPEDAGPPLGCNSVMANGPAVSPMLVAGSRPAAAGGAIADGTYWLTESDVYTANWEGNPEAGLPPSSAMARTLVVAGMTLQKAESASSDAGPAGTDTSTSFISVSGSVLSETLSCPFAAGAATATSFSVVGSDLWLFPQLYSREVYTHQ